MSFDRAPGFAGRAKGVLLSSYQADLESATRSDSAFAAKTVEVDAVRLRYREAGSGPVLLCLHGGGGLRLSRTHEMLAETHRVIAFELPGFGETASDPRFATVADLANLMHRAVAALAIDRYDLMGHGLGAGLALAMALQRPDPVDAIVLIAPRAIRPVPAAETGSRTIAGIETETFEAALAELQVPVLALFGTADRVTPTAAARHYRARLPHCHVVMVYDAAHALDADRPEAVTSVIADFLERRESFIVRKDSGLIHP